MTTISRTFLPGLSLSWIEPRPGKVFPAVWLALRYLVGSRVEDEEKSRWNLAGLLIVLLVGLVTYQWILLGYREVDRPVVADSNAVWEEFQRTPSHPFQFTPDGPIRGPEQATIEMVIFSDFQCPFCKTFARYLEPVMEQYKDRLRVSFRHFPFSPQCNPALSQELHPLACQAASLAQAAHLQGRFWDVHDAFFTSDLEQLSDLKNALRELGLDPEQLEQQALSSAVQEKIQSDIRLGLELKLPGTPTVFLNGRHVQDANQLEYLLDRLSRE